MKASRIRSSCRIAGQFQELFPGRMSKNHPKNYLVMNTISRTINIHIKVPYERDMVTLSAKPGQTIKDLVDENERLRQYLECACDGNAACSTCHVIVDKDFYGKLDPPEQAELDMVDLAWGVTETSRLGCQLVLNEKCEGLALTIPKQSNNLMEPEIFFDR